MILKFLINSVRMLWGYGSFQPPDKIDDAMLFLMMFGALLDLGAIAVVLGLIGTISHARKRK